MKISFITTVDHNVGDDFVREGLKYLLREHFKGTEIEFQNIHKHSPITTRHGLEWFRDWRLSRRVDKVLPLNLFKDRTIEADLLVQSGAPVYWCHSFEGTHCYENEWFQPLIERRFLASSGQKLMNLAAGTCQTYHSDGSEFCDRCLTYMQRFLEIADVTTLRDKLSQDIYKRLGQDVEVLPCSSIFAVDEHNIQSKGADYVALNYMSGGAHYTFGQKIDSLRWQSEFAKFYFDLKRNERVVLVCHDNKEAVEAKRLDPSAEVFYVQDDYVAYMEFYSRAKFGVVNRVHAGFMMASMGKPSIVIGNDSRARMAEQVGLKHFFVNDVDAASLASEVTVLQASLNKFRLNYAHIKENALQGYRKVFSQLGI